MKTFFSIIFGLIMSAVAFGTIYFLNNRTAVVDNSKASTITLEGSLEIINCNYIKGWAWDSNGPSVPMRVNFYLDKPAGQTTLLTSVIADIERKDISVLKTNDNGKHGFQFNIPAQMKDGQTHKIYAYVVDYYDSSKYYELETSPGTLMCKK